jgi:hypothetical protein
MAERHTYRFTPAEKLSSTRTRMATVEVFTSKGKSIGSYAFSRDKPSQTEITDMVRELIRDYWVGKVWS